MASSGFYDLNVHSVPAGSSTIEGLSSIAKHFGYSGIAITNPEKVPVKTPVIATDGFEILKGVEIKAANASKLHGLVGKYRNRVDVVAVCGGSESINRAAVENPNVDVLVSLNTPRDNGFNHVLAKEASDKNVAISFDLGELIRLRGGRRVHALSNFRMNLRLHFTTLLFAYRQRRTAWLSACCSLAFH